MTRNEATMKKHPQRPPSKRNPVMRQALVRRPTLASVRAADSSCPICSAPAESLVLETIPEYRAQAYALALLGISCVRWMRGLKTMHCLSCGFRYFNAELLSWNSARKARRFADFGQTWMPLPVRGAARGQKCLRDALLAKLSPRARAVALNSNRRRKVLGA